MPVRAKATGFAAIRYVIVLLPVPLAGAGRVIQELVVVAAHGQSAPGVLMAKEFVAAGDVCWRDVGEISKAQKTPNCEIANGWPPIRTTPERGEAERFGRTV